MLQSVRGRALHVLVCGREIIPRVVSAWFSTMYMAVRCVLGGRCWAGPHPLQDGATPNNRTPGKGEFVVARSGQQWPAVWPDFGQT